MQRYKLLLLLFFVYNLQSNAQSEPIVVLENFEIIDIHIMDESIVYATRGELKQVSNQGVVSRMDKTGHVNGRFLDTEEGYIYFGWEADNDDYSLPGLVILEQFTDTLIRNELNLVDEFIENPFAIQSAVYHSLEDMKILTSTIYDQTQWIYTLNSNGDFIDTLTLNSNEVLDMYIISNDSYLLQGVNSVSIMVDGNIVFDKYLGDNIIDLNIYENTQIIEVLTKNTIFRFNYDLNIISQTDLILSDKNPVAVYRNNDSTTLVRALGRYSYLYENTSANLQNEYKETVPVRYKNAEIKNGTHVIWGRNGCYPRGSIMKIGKETLLMPLDSVDLTADYFTVEKVGELEEQIIQSNGDTIIKTKDINIYEIGITNNGNQAIDSFVISVGRQNIVFLPFFFIEEFMLLPVGESRVYRDTIYNSGNNMKLCMYSESIESDCSDNIIYSETITSVIEDEVYHQSLLYPNPSSSLLFIDSDGAIDYQIFSHCGVAIMSGDIVEGESIDLSNLPNGNYFIRIRSDKLGLLIKKFLKI